MKIALCLVLASSFAFAQTTATSGSASNSAMASPTAASDSVLSALLSQTQGMAEKSDADISRLRIDKWKADSASKQQSETMTLSIRRNLANAVPDLVRGIQASPNSLNANFRLYRNLNVLYDTFSSLVESAGAFGPKEQYEPLAADINQLDQIRRQLAERVDLLAGTSDAELARLRAQIATGAKPATKIVVNDDQPQPKPKKKAKTTPPPAQPPTQ